MKAGMLKQYLLLTGLVVGLASPTVNSSPIISELFYDASGGDAGKVFIELFGKPGESLNGLVLEGINGGDGSVYTSLALSGLMPGDGIFVIGDDSGGATAVANADLIADIDYQNGPDSVVLRGISGILDAVGYGIFSAGEVFAGEGTPAPDAPGGSSLERFNPFIDSNDNGADFRILGTPTPGSVPGVSNVPLPAGAWLFGSGLMALLGWRRQL